MGKTNNTADIAETHGGGTTVLIFPHTLVD